MEVLEEKIKTRKDELRGDLARVAYHFATTEGMPLDIFEEVLAEKCPTIGDQWRLVAAFKKSNPELWKA